MRANEFEFREQPVDAPDAPARSRGPAASCVRPADPPRHSDADAWWAAIDERIAQALAAEREAIFEELTPVIRSLREMYEALHEQLTETRWQRLGTAFGTRRSAYRALKKWGDEECARIEAESLERKRSKDDV
jgi:hypothetical protein